MPAIFPAPWVQGGMLSKIKAARKVTAAGIPMVIAKGSRPDILIRLAAGEAMARFSCPGSKS
jgi:glutamate 5-kinase